MHTIGLKDTGESYGVSDTMLSEKRAALHECFQALDENGQSILVLIRSIDRLKEKNPIWWLPLQTYHNIRFVISSRTVLVGSTRKILR